MLTFKEVIHFFSQLKQVMQRGRMVVFPAEVAHLSIEARVIISSLAAIKYPVLLPMFVLQKLYNLIKYNLLSII
jgi:hypothetical protein